MLRKIRILFALLFYVAITLLLLDFSGALHAWLGWTAKVQFLPAILALNFGVVAALVALTLLFGRLYCSIICPLGVMQDLFSWFAARRKKNRFSYSPAKRWLRYTMLALFIVAMVAHVGFLGRLIAPYSAYGRIVNNLFQPLWQLGNNLLALIAERLDSYAFYEVDVWIKSLPTFIIALVTFIVIGILAWRSGRTWCNTICPVGTVLGFLAKYALSRPVIDTTKCNGCKRCARNCKASCIDAANHQIDYSRCVACMDCLEMCKQGAISYTARRQPAADQAATPQQDRSRRRFLGIVGIMAASAVRAEEKKVDGGLAAIERKKVPNRQRPVTPAGSLSARHLLAHCTSCQLCVSACPNGVLRPSNGLMTLMQPTLSFERGYCRPECTRCADVCPTGAIQRISVEEKSAIKIGTAHTIHENCIVLRDGVSCGNCERHCPTGAITMVAVDPDNPDSLKIPHVKPGRCIGCGSCEYHCPARPLSAIYVEGSEIHHEI